MFAIVYGVQTENYACSIMGNTVLKEKREIYCVRIDYIGTHSIFVRNRMSFVEPYGNVEIFSLIAG